MATAQAEIEVQRAVVQRAKEANRFAIHCIVVDGSGRTCVADQVLWLTARIGVVGVGISTPLAPYALSPCAFSFYSCTPPRSAEMAGIPRTENYNGPDQAGAAQTRCSVRRHAAALERAQQHPF